MHNYNDEVEDSFQAFLVEGAEFTPEEEYPIIRSDMVPDRAPERIMPFSKAITFQGDLSHTAVCFFSPDKTFERVRRNPRRYLPFFKKTAGIIGLDFSVHSDMPLIKQKSQMNDNLSLSFFYGNYGIPLYPSARCGAETLEDEYLKAFPKGTLIALGVHGFVKESQEKCEWLCWINKLVSTLRPSGFIVVGHLNGPLFDKAKAETPFYFYDYFIEERGKEVASHVN